MTTAIPLKSILLKGYKSIDHEGQSIELGPITILLGANGAGKSNLVSFLRLVNYITTGGLNPRGSLTRRHTPGPDTEPICIDHGRGIRIGHRPRETPDFRRCREP